MHFSKIQVRNNATSEEEKTRDKHAIEEYEIQMEMGSR